MKQNTLSVKKLVLTGNPGEEIAGTAGRKRRT